MIYRKPIGTVAYMGGVPCNLEEFTWAWGQMVAYNYEYLAQPDEFVHLMKSPISEHSQARNYFVPRFLGDWLFMTDMDHAFQPDLVARMVSCMYSYDIDVLTGLYFLKAPPHFPTIYVWSEETHGFLHVADWDREAPLLKPDCSGAGCLLVRRRVFERIERELREPAFSCKPPYSEDFSFFTRLRELGIPLYCDPRIESHHLAVRKLSAADWDPSQIMRHMVNR